MAAIRRLGPDVVVCDLGLPVVDGYEVARVIRASGEGATLVALSGYASPDDVERSIRAGFDHHLGKPADLELLLGIVAATTPKGGSTPAVTPGSDEA